MLKSWKRGIVCILWGILLAYPLALTAAEAVQRAPTPILPQAGQKAFTEAKQAEVNAKMATVQMPFIANQGQMDADVAFYAKTFGGTVFVTQAGEIVYALPKREGEETKTGVALRETFVGGNVRQVTGAGEAVTRVSSFKGKDPAAWQSDLPTYQEINLGEVYPGIDLTLKARGNNVEKLFVVQPGAAPDAITLRVEGAQRLSVNAAGELEAATGLGIVKFTKPVAYQERDGQRKPVDVAYLVAEQGYGFVVGDYDPRAVLIIDPLLASTFLGGNSMDHGYAIALDSNGNVYVTGTTNSPDFPTTPGAADTSLNGGSDTFIAKFDGALHTLLSATFLGGALSDFGNAISLDNSGNVYVTGHTYSSDFPTTPSAYDTSYNGYEDVFVVKFDSALHTLLASTFLGGKSWDDGRAVALDSSGNVYVTGWTMSSDFPATPVAADISFNGGSDTFIAKFDSALHTLLASTFLGGNGNDEGYMITLDNSGNVYVTGQTKSADFSTTAGAYDTSNNGGFDVFVAKFDGALHTLLAATFLGGNGNDQGYMITLDSSGNVYVTGYTASSDFPTTSGAYDTSYHGTDDAFVAKFDSALHTLLASTFLGGKGWDDGRSAALDSSGNVYVTGHTGSSDFPTTAGAYDTSYHGVFIAKFDSALHTLLAATFLGGTMTDYGYAIVLDSNGNVYVTGEAGSSDFPTTAGAYDTSYHGVFVAKLDGNLSGDSGGNGNAGVWGHVQDVNGNRITGVNVMVKLTGPATRQTTYSDGRYFAFTDIAAGDYTIEATTSDGRTSGAQQITLSDSIISNIDLTVRQQGVCNSGGRTPILLVPGVMGSTVGGLLMIPVLPQQAPAYNDFSKWKTDKYAYKGLYDDGVGWKALALTLQQDYGYEVGCTLFPVPYDWRMDLQNAANTYLTPWINEAKRQTGASKVNIIAHSMGGLVARAYIQSGTYANTIDKLAMVGTPNHGATVAYYLWQGGDPWAADVISSRNHRKFSPAYTAVARSQYFIFNYTNPPLTLPQPSFYKFFRDHMPSMNQLLPTYPCVNDRALECDYNVMLTNLNAQPSRFLMGTENDTGKVRTKVFAGTDQTTILSIPTTWKNCGRLLYEDGVPLYFPESGSSGDGTVPKASAYLDFASYTETAGEHMNLIEKHHDNIIAFMCSDGQCGTVKLAEARLLSENQTETAQSSLTIGMFGRAQLFLTDPLGRKIGITPGSPSVVNDIPNSAFSTNEIGTAITIPGAVAGNYTLSLKNGYTENYLLTFEYADQSDSVWNEYHGFSHADTVAFTFNFDPTSPAKIVINRTPTPPTALKATVNGANTRLTWTASTDAAVTKYNIYAKNDGEQYFQQIGVATSVSYDTADPWAGSPTRMYMVASVKADGSESFLSEMASNNDRDQDGLSDADEAIYGTKVDNPDTDGDGLKDGEEVLLYGTDPLKPDTDGDSYSDFVEVQAGTDPLDPKSFPTYAIAIKQGETIVPAGGTSDFGIVNTETNKTLSFTIENTGSALLNLTGSPIVQISGANAADFVVTVQPSTPVTPASSATFELTFTPKANGGRTAQVSIPNNVPGKSPYTFTITGTGREIKCLDRTICNGDFEQGLTYWQDTANAAIVPNGRTGNGLQVAHDSANSDAYQFLTGVFDGGKTYQVTAWCLSQPGDQCGVYLGDANNWYNPPPYQNEARQFLYGNGQWQQIAVALTLSQAEMLSVYLYAPTPGSTVIYDDVQIAEVCGNRAVCNGSFEQGLTAWSLTGNESLVAGRSGNGVRIANDANNADIAQMLPGVFQPDTAYRVTAWCFAPLGAQCGLFFGDANDVFNPPAYQSQATTWMPGTGSWQPISVIVTPRQAERMSVYLYARTAGSAVIYDDVSVAPLPPLACADRSVCNGDFERGLEGWYSIDNAAIGTGRNGQGVTVTADANNGDLYQLLPGVFAQNKTYQVTAWCLAQAGATCQLYVGDVNAFYGAPYEHEAKQVVPGTGAWQQLRVTVTLKHDERLNVYLYAPTAGSAVTYDDVQATEIAATACSDRTVCNGDFEQGFGYWWSFENAALVPGRSGQGVRVNQDGANDDIFQFMEGVFAGSASYRVSAWCLAAPGKRCGIYLGDANTWYNPPANQQEIRQWILGNGSWQPLAATLTLGQAERLSVYLYAPDAPVVYDDVQIAAVPSYLVTVTTSGSGSGVVTGSGLNCGTTCTARYADGTLLNVKATPAAGSRFAGWLVNGQPVTGDVTITADVTVTAVFAKP